MVTVRDGHILPKDLYAFLAGRLRHQEAAPHTPTELMELFEENLGLYLQMIDPSAAGPATDDMLSVFAALNNLGVIAVRPILLAIAASPNAEEGMRHVLQLVVRRIAVGGLGTGNVERRFGEAAKKIWGEKDWQAGTAGLKDLIPSRLDFISQLSKRSYNKATLAFLRRSTVEKSMFPSKVGTLHFICPRQAEDWEGMDEDNRAFWCATIGNTFLSRVARRPSDSSDWLGFKAALLPTAVDNEVSNKLAGFEVWNVESILQVGAQLAEQAADVWY